MRSLFNFFLFFILRRPVIILALFVTSLALGFFAKLGYQQFIYLQSQNISNLSVFNEVIIPLTGLTLVCQLMMSILASVQLLPTIKMSGQESLISHASISPHLLYWSLLKPIILMGCWPLLYAVLIIGVIAVNSQLDLIRLSILMLSLLLINFSSTFIIFAVSLLVRRPLLVLVFSMASIMLLITFEISLRFWWSDSPWQGLFLPYFSLREGMLRTADIVVYLGWIIAGVSSCYLILVRHVITKKLTAQSFLLIGVMAIFMAKFFPGQFDLSRDLRSSLAETITQQLLAQDEVLEITAVVNQETSREEVLRGFQIVQQIAPQSRLHFRSRQTLPPNQQHAGEYLEFKLGKVQQLIAYPFEQKVKTVFEAAISQLFNRKLQWITFIEGHGEASPFATKSSDLGELYRSLSDMGWPIAVQNLIKMPVISQNTNLLVIAASKQQWLSTEIKLIIEYLERGGNLLLLVDPDSVVPIAIEKFLGISRYSGTLVDWSGFQSGTPHPAVVIVNQMSEHPVTSQLNSLLAFPWASGLHFKANDNVSNITIKPVITTNKSVWNEFNIEQEKLTFDEDMGELQQPFHIALAYRNTSTQQKVVVIGDSHFISDTAINNYGNKQFAFNLISWLTNLEVAVESQLNELDSHLVPSQWRHFTMSWVFNLILPFMLLFFWWLIRRRRYRYVDE